MRRRKICHTRLINYLCGRDTLEGVAFTHREQQLLNVLKGDWCFCIDFSAYYDQFPLPKEIGVKMVMQIDGKYYRPTSLLMGQRHAVEVAQTATQVLTTVPFEHNCVIECYIDNIRVVGDKDEVRKVARCIVERCKQANVQINEDVSTDAKIDELIVQEGDWLGVHYNYKSKEVTVAEKTIKKLEKVRELMRAGWTWQQMGAHYGLLFFTQFVQGTHLAKYFHALNYLRRGCKYLQANVRRWRDWARRRRMGGAA